MAGWPSWAAPIVRAVVGSTAGGDNSPTNPIYVATVAGGGVVPISGTVTADQGAAAARSDAWPVINAPTPGAPAAYRTAVVAADVLAIPGTVTCTKVAGGAATAGTYTVFVVAGNTYGRTTARQGNTTVTTETTNLTVAAAFAAVTGATFYDIYCSVDGAASKFLGRVTEAQRAAGCAITAQNTVGAGGVPGSVYCQFPGTGLAVNGGQVAQNMAYTPESLTPITTTGYENLDLNVTFSRTGDSVAGSLVLMPFYAGASGYYAGDPVPVSFGGVANAYESNRQTFRLPVRGRACVICVGAIAGTGASVNLETVLS